MSISTEGFLNLDTIRVGIAGWGLSATIFHLPFLKCNTSFAITHVLQRHGEECTKALPDVTLVRSMEELVLAPVDVIIICTPSGVHFQHARLAIKNGKHVVVEKPLTTTLSDALELARLAQEAGVLLNVFHNRRWDGDFLTTQDVIREGLLGDVTSFESRIDRFRPMPKLTWRNQSNLGGGTLLDIGSHLIDQTIQLFGPPDALFGDVTMQRQKSEVDDWFDLSLFYDKKPALRVCLKSSSLCKEPLFRFAVHGTCGSFIKKGMDPQEAALREGQLPKQTTWGNEASELWGKITSCLSPPESPTTITTRPGNYGEFYTALANSLKNNSAVPVHINGVLQTMAIIDVARLSTSRGRLVRPREIWPDWPNFKLR